MRRTLCLLALSLTLALPACDSDPSAPDPSAIAGVWTLQTVNGNGLPMFLLQSTDTIQVLSGSITLNQDGSFRDVTTYRITRSGLPATNEDELYTGTFLKTAAGATLRPDGFDPYRVAISGDGVMTQIIGGFELAYRR